METAWAAYTLDFRFLARTSRESMTRKSTYFIRLRDGNRTAYGECALFRGLSADDSPDYEEHLSYWTRRPLEVASCPHSSIRFGIETALNNLSRKPSEWHSGQSKIPINGLIWMGNKQEMCSRIDAKLNEGFRVLKLKIGGISFDDEMDLLAMIRQRYGADTLELRLDANGSFSPATAPDRLGRLSRYEIHSIEQPIRAGQPEEMQRLCANSPIPIALDEELIGTSSLQHKHQILEFIRPAFIILKPALCGGLSGAREWADVAEENHIAYWFTSARESNIGLDASATIAVERGITMPQGLGTGELYHNNIAGPIYRCGNEICYNPLDLWQIPTLDWNICNF